MASHDARPRHGGAHVQDQLRIAEIVDVAQLTADLDRIGAARGDSRPALLQRLRQAKDEGRAEAERMLFEDGSGLLCAQRISVLQDILIRAISEFALDHVFEAQNLSAAERVAVLAVGGYGRGTLAPGSDIDLLFLLPYKQTALGEQCAEYLLYLLWDLGFKVGHATRSVEECIRLSQSDFTIRTAILDRRLIVGNAALFDELSQRYDKEIVAATSASNVPRVREVAHAPLPPAEPTIAFALLLSMM